MGRKNQKQAVFAVVAIAAVLVVIFFLLSTMHSGAQDPLSRTRLGIVGLCEFQPADFVADMDSVSEAAFNRPYDAEKHGAQKVSVTVKDAAGKKRRVTASLYLIRPRNPLEFELGEIPEPLTPQALFDQRELEDAPVEAIMEWVEAPALPQAPGEQIVRLRLDGQEYALALRLEDTKAPKLTLKDADGYLGVEMKPEAFVEEIIDESDVVLRFAAQPDLTKKGRQTVEIIATDAGGNETKAKARLTLEECPDPPEILGVQDIRVGLAGTISYRKGVTLVDPTGTAELVIDSSKVDTNKPGVYTVTYSATNAAGLSASVTAKVTVAGVSEEAVIKLAQPVLDRIIRPGMSGLEKAKAIHSWIRANIGYNNTGEKKGVLEGAYNGFTLRRGDCYTFYALTKFMLDQVGVESVDIHRVEGKPTRHYWLLLNFGDGWKHYDTCPVRKPSAHPHNGIMMTDSEAQGFGRAIGRDYYYEYDPASLPEGVTVVP